MKGRMQIVIDLVTLLESADFGHMPPHVKSKVLPQRLEAGRELIKQLGEEEYKEFMIAIESEVLGNGYKNDNQSQNE